MVVDNEENTSKPENWAERKAFLPTTIPNTSLKKEERARKQSQRNNRVKIMRVNFLLSLESAAQRLEKTKTDVT